MEKRSYYALILFIILSVFFNIGNFFSLVFTSVGFDLTNFTMKDMAYADILMKGIIFILVLISYRDVFIDDFLAFKEKLRINISKVIQFFVMMMSVKVVVGIICALIATVLGIDLLQSENQNIVDTFTDNAPVMMFISSVILAPFFEEGIFRLGFKKVFKRKYLFILTSGLIFGLMHIFPTDLSLSLSLLQATPYIAMGILLAYFYENNPNIYLVIFAHALNNLLGIIAILWFI